MMTTELNQVFQEQMQLCADLLEWKAAEYTGNADDRLSAFKSAAALQHCTPDQALVGMLAKHVISLFDMAFAGADLFSMEMWEEKITDSINYLVLLKAVLVEGRGNG